MTDAIETATALLALPALEQQQAFLRAKQHLNAEGLAALLDIAGEWLGEDPGQARRLAEICSALADSLNEIGLVARADYLRAQTHHINAEFEIALTLIETARTGYLQADQPYDALRTNVGRMVVLTEVGRYDEALAAGQAVIGQVNDAASEDADMNLLAGMAQQNMGMAYELLSCFDDAMTAYATAEERYRTLGLAMRMADVSNNRGVVLLNLGRALEALAAFENAAILFAENNLSLKHAQALINLGDAHLLVGQYTPGLAALDKARALLAPLEAQADKQVLLLDVADAHLALNLYPEALTAYQEADAAFSEVGMTHDHARALWGAGSALLAQQRWHDAGLVLSQAAAAFEAAQNTPMLCQTQLQQAALLLAQGERRAALALARQVLGVTSGKDWPMLQAQTHLRIAELLWPDATRALPHIRAAANLVAHVGLPVLHQQTQQQLGHAHLLLGNFAEAERILLDAITDIEQSRSTLVQERMRAAFLGDKLAAYEDLIGLYLQRQQVGDPARAFDMAERAKSRALADVLSGQIQPMLLNHADAESAVQTRLRALQSELDTAYTALLRNEGERDQESTQAKALALERELSRLQLQLPASKTSDANSEPHEHDTLARLPDDAVVISYMICGDDIVAFVVAQHHVVDARIVTQITKIQPLMEKLQAQWNRFREGAAFTQRHMPLLIQSAQSVLHELHAALLDPISQLFGQALSTLHTHKLVIVPHGLLHHVPFHALFNGNTDHYVIDDYEVSYIPSATLWGLCQQRLAPEASRAAVFGVSDVLIPAAEAEAHAVAQQLPGASLRVNESATLAEFQSHAPGCAMVHLACHGFFRADNPLFSALKLHDGWLMAADVPMLDLRGALVTLSACESGRSQVLAGDELVGLSRAFLGAGAATLVTSLWLVHDETTATLMQTFYAHLTNHVARAAALRQAQLALKASHPHPYFWAAFVLVGQR